MPKISEEKKKARREEIISSAFRCFATKGFAETTMRDIFNASGLSSGAVYSYFENKEAIVYELCARRTEDYVEHLERRTKEDVEIGTLLSEIIESYTRGFGEEMFDQKSKVNAQMWSAGIMRKELREAGNVLFERYVQALSDPISRAQDRKEIDPDLAPKMVAEVMITMIFGLDLRRASQEDFDVKAFAKVTRSLFLGQFNLKDNK